MIGKSCCHVKSLLDSQYLLFDLVEDLWGSARIPTDSKDCVFAGGIAGDSTEICYGDDATIFEHAKMIKKWFPEYDIPQEFEGIDQKIGLVHFSSKKILELGFKFRYSMEEMFDAGIQTCREMKLIPLYIRSFMLLKSLTRWEINRVNTK
ncbi:hypothetical protein J5N97_004242 [Dioscorea zingiberensis]|uniref:Uncharacterized protein n=1 Tax=Dioscorea zingiberensis TaxID=325984 RepID=A0A9D5D667_9LILI|nr:hypothetical protein J5N97_004242 [Dioscorea zingiberensis]